MITSVPSHTVSMVIAGAELTGWLSYDITVSMLDPVDTYRLQLPFSREAWDLTAPDRLVQIFIDGAPLLNGFIESSSMPDDAEVIDLGGRCRMGRLADDCAGTINFQGLSIVELAKTLASPFFASVTLSNARNRALVRGKGKRARAAAEPLTIRTQPKVGTTIEPGQTRWATLEKLLDQAGYLARSSGDGRELILCRPNYDQEIQFVFRRTLPAGARAAEATVLGMAITRDLGDCYARVLVVGSGAGTDVSYGATVASRAGEAKDNPDTADGTGLNFSVPKTLIVQHAARSITEADELAEREMARRAARSRPITVRCAGHGQVIAGAFTTLFAPDLLALIEDEFTGTKGVYLITSCTYRSTREGEETIMELVPSGTELNR
jgi:prophage tail gpP-like protein